MAPLPGDGTSPGGEDALRLIARWGNGKNTYINCHARKARPPLRRNQPPGNDAAADLGRVFRNAVFILFITSRLAECLQRAGNAIVAVLLLLLISGAILDGRGQHAIPVVMPEFSNGFQDCPLPLLPPVAGYVPLPVLWMVDQRSGVQRRFVNFAAIWAPSCASSRKATWEPSKCFRMTFIVKKIPLKVADPSVLSVARLKTPRNLEIARSLFHSVGVG